MIEQFLKKYQFLKPVGSFSVDSDVIDALTQLELPGNARQLENVVRWALVNKDDESPLNLRDLPLDMWQQLSEQGKRPWVQLDPVDEAKDVLKSTAEAPQQEMFSTLLNLLDLNGWNLSQALQHCERLLLEAALHKACGNQSQTARLLGITPRSVYNKVRKHQLQR